MTTLSESKYLGDVLKYEAPNLYSREEVIVAKGQNLKLGTVVGLQSKDAVTLNAKEGNKGNGTITDISLGPFAWVGVYTAIAETKDSFILTAPDGITLPQIKPGTPYGSSHLHLTLTAGDTEFEEGDAFTIEVTGSSKVAAFSPDAVDGSQTPIGIVMTDCNATDEETKAVIITRHAFLSDDGLVWPDDITERQKKTATLHLESRGLVIRKGV